MNTYYYASNTTKKQSGASPVIDRQWLFDAFVSSTFVCINGYDGFIKSIMREDGSGHKFIITFYSGHTTFVRTN